MSDRLEPPKRYNNNRFNDDFEDENNYRKKNKRRRSSDSNEKIIKSEKTFTAFRKSDIFVTGGFDVPFFALTMALLAVGLVMLFSASYPTSYFKYGNSYHYFIRQLIFAFMGVVIMLIVSKINYKWFKAVVPILLGVTTFLLILVLFYHTKVETDGGEAFKRYMKIPGTPFTFQPSDIAKFTLIVTLASFMTTYARKLNTFKYGIFYPALFTGSFCILIYLENHVSGTILVFLIGLIMMYAGGSAQGKNKILFIIGVCLVVAAIFVVLMFPDILPDYVNRKLEAWRNKDLDPRGVRWQNNNSLYAIGSGSFLGVGLGNSKQKYLYVSEPQNDFIFSIVCEELGFIGAILIIVLFGALIVRGFIIALRTTDRFASLTVIGIVAQVGVQVAFNILVVTDTIPNTGIALPFFSYGGTALLMLLFEMGVVLGISRKSNQKKV